MCGKPSNVLSKRISRACQRQCVPSKTSSSKVVADRAKDWIDIEGVLMRQRGKLDINSIRDWLTQFAEALEKPELLTRFNNLYETT
jgi:hypothetical protein